MILNLFKLLPKNLKARTYLIILLAIVSTLVDLLGVASIMPLVELVQKEDIPDSSINRVIYLIFGELSSIEFKTIFAILSLIFIVSGVSLKATLVHFQYKVSHTIEAYFSSLLFKKYLKFDFSWFKNNHTSSLSKNILTEVSFVIAEAILPLIKLITDFIFIICLTAFLLVVNLKATITIFFIFLLAYLLIYGISKERISKYGKLRLKLNELRFRTLEEYISLIRDIKIFHKEDYFVKSFKQTAFKYSTAHAISKTLTFLPKFFIEGLVFISVVVFLLIVVIFNINILDYIPIITLYLMAMYKFLPSVQQIIISSGKLKNSVPSVKELYGVLQTPTQERLKDKTNIEKSNIQSLKFKDINFSFDEETPLFSHLNLELQSHGFIALVGPSGSGKSTLLDIISGITIQNSGSVYSDDVELNRLYNETSLAYVSQDVFMLDASFYENIAFGLPLEEIDKKRVKEICKKVQLDSWILESFNDGYETKIGQNGSRISGGQKQRIGIARAFYTDPKVLVLDESTSALNITLELDILSLIKEFSIKNLVLFSSHSLDVLNYADKIIYVKEGAVKEFESLDMFKQSENYKDYVSKNS